tara:strand:+ start:544 stop:774 length:231 start_codon:yes stop_codon:yes gene_type:complete
MQRKKRDYKKEYNEYHSKPEQKKNRASRNTARQRLQSNGRVMKGDRNDVDHKDGNPRNNIPSNLQVMSRSANRSKK